MDGISNMLYLYSVKDVNSTLGLPLWLAIFSYISPKVYDRKAKSRQKLSKKIRTFYLLKVHFWHTEKVFRRN